MVGLNVFTVGGVIEPGQAVMEIVPEGRSLVIQSQVDPADADDVAEGETAQVRFVSVHDRTLPLLHGTIRTMSADAFTDKKTGRSYFRAEVVVPEDQLDRVRHVLGRGNLRPGLDRDAQCGELRDGRARVRLGSVDERQEPRELQIPLICGGGRCRLNAAARGDGDHARAIREEPVEHRHGSLRHIDAAREYGFRCALRDQPDSSVERTTTEASWRS